jgi:hypothetical protein
LLDYLVIFLIVFTGSTAALSSTKMLTTLMSLSMTALLVWHLTKYLRCACGLRRQMLAMAQVRSDQYHVQSSNALQKAFTLTLRTADGSSLA